MSLQYRKNAHYNTTHRRRQNLYALPSRQWQLLADPPFSILDTLTAVDDAIDHNADLADAIFNLGITSLGLDETPAADSPLNWHSHAQPNDMSKAHSTIRQFYRDWSHKGFIQEVRPLLDIISEDLDIHMTGPRSDRRLSNILLPGAGLGRILFELCRWGWNITGNEISYHQLLASNFILNATTNPDQYEIYPFATTFTNTISRENQLARHTIPDTHPAQTLAELSSTGHPIGEMNMTAGDFVLSYSGPDTRESFDAVISVFFIDTAPNLFRYIETVRNCLKPNGTWINIGPLLWHFDDRVHGGSHNEGDSNSSGGRQKAEVGQQTQQSHSHSNNTSSTPTGSSTSTHQQTGMLDKEDQGIAEPGSFELSDEEVTRLVSKLGFEILKHEILDNNGAGFGYMQDPSSLLQNRYKCSHWVARKL
ncbi:N2227-like protein [Exophiala viscosa]|uniref:N2227-like protein n=1 Tax=Exophiala viscosa TaxID=2486360 RepID=UPI002195B8D7|nr:N2227-like protein [Exophiala viscosa]